MNVGYNLNREKKKGKKHEMGASRHQSRVRNTRCSMLIGMNCSAALTMSPRTWRQQPRKHMTAGGTRPSKCSSVGSHQQGGDRPPSKTKRKREGKRRRKRDGRHAARVSDARPISSAPERFKRQVRPTEAWAGMRHGSLSRDVRHFVTECRARCCGQCCGQVPARLPPRARARVYAPDTPACRRCRSGCRGCGQPIGTTRLRCP